MAILNFRKPSGEFQQVPEIQGERGKPGKGAKILPSGGKLTWWEYDDVIDDYIDTGIVVSGGSGDDIIPFPKPSERENVATGDTLSTIIGKVWRWFADLKTLAFKDKIDWNTDIDNKPTSMPASDVSAWAKAAEKPTYTASEVGASPSNHNHNGVYVPVVAGKGLSTNDYTNTDKAEVAKVKNKANKSTIKSATLTAANWVDDTANSGFWKYTVNDASIVDNVLVAVVVAETSIQTANDSGVVQSGMGNVGSFTMLATEKPASDIVINYKIIE